MAGQRGGDALGGATDDARRARPRPGIGLDHGYAALTVLELGAGHYEAALRAARRVADHDAIPLGVLGLADLVEAAVRAGHPNTSRRRSNG